MMTVRCSKLFSVSRFMVQHARTFSSRKATTNEETLNFFSSAKDNQKKPLVTQNSPDVFGTLRPEKLLTVEPLFDNVCDEGDIEEEKFLGFEPVKRKSIEKYEEEVQKLIENKQLKEAFQVLEIEMKEERVRPSRNIYSLLLGACGKVGYTKKAFMLFNDMKKREKEPSESHYTALFNACANSPWKEDGLGRAKKLRQQLADSRYPLNQKQYHAMIKVFGRCGDIGTALEILDEMKKKRIVITTETLNFVLQACISLPQEGFKYALMVWRKLRQAKVTPDIYSYHLMLRAARDCGVNDIKAFEQDFLRLPSSSNDQTLAITSSRQLSPDSSLSGTDNFTLSNGGSSPKSVASTERVEQAKLPNLLSEKEQTTGLVQIQNLNRPEDRLALIGGLNGFLQEMKKDHAKPDIKTFTLMLETVGSTQQDEMLLLKKMEEVRIEPDVDFVNLLIKKRQLRRDFFAAKDGLQLLQRYNLFPNIMTFGVLALGCRNIRQCVNFCRTMKDAGLRMNKEIYGSLLKNAVYHKDCGYIMHLTKYAKDNDLPLDEKALKLLSDFKSKTTAEIAKSDRGEKVNPIYDEPEFRKSFGTFCKTFKPTLKQLEVDLDPHPWAQFRYERNAKCDKHDSNPLN